MTALCVVSPVATTTPQTHTQNTDKGCHQQVSVIGSTAYVPQSPFILGGTVRDNIMFGRQYDEERYRRAVQAAQLEPDLAQLQAGDMTELGEWGSGVVLTWCVGRIRCHAHYLITQEGAEVDHPLGGCQTF